MSDYDDDYEPEFGAEEMVDTTKATGEGVTVTLNQYAMQRIEEAAMIGVRQEVSNKIDAMIESEITDVISQKLGEVVGRLADATILEYLTKPRPRTNAYGERVSGTPMTIADQIPEKVEAYMSEKVNAEGRQDRNYGKTTRLEHIMSTMVVYQLNAATKTAASQVTEQAKKVVAAHVGRFVAEQMIPQIDVTKPSN